MSDWRWKLRLFASADLVGSTAYKVSLSSSVTPEWASTFREFFKDFPAFVETIYSRLPENHVPCSQTLKPWKFLGDEILFVVELKCCQEALSHINVLRMAVAEFPKLEWRKKGLPLQLKAAAWLAGFPLTNTEIKIPSHPDLVDFIGPSIDLGFRIAKFADPRRLILSADLALLLLDGIDALEADKTSYRMGFTGREVLKGVIGNEPYPILWLGIPDETLFLEEDLLRTPCELGKLTDYLRKYLSTTPKLNRPFIADDPHVKYASIPEKFNQVRDQLQSEDSCRDYKTTAEEPEPAPSGPPRALTDPKPPAEIPSEEVGES